MVYLIKDTYEEDPFEDRANFSAEEVDRAKQVMDNEPDFRAGRDADYWGPNNEYIGFIPCSNMTNSKVQVSIALKDNKKELLQALIKILEPKFFLDVEGKVCPVSELFE